MSIVENPNPLENPNFDYKDLSTLENHWTYFKGKAWSDTGVKHGFC